MKPHKKSLSSEETRKVREKMGINYTIPRENDEEPTAGNQPPVTANVNPSPSGSNSKANEDKPAGSSRDAETPKHEKNPPVKPSKSTGAIPKQRATNAKSKTNLQSTSKKNCSQGRSNPAWAGTYYNSGSRQDIHTNSGNDSQISKVQSSSSFPENRNTYASALHNYPQNPKRFPELRKPSTTKGQNKLTSQVTTKIYENSDLTGYNQAKHPTSKKHNQTKHPTSKKHYLNPKKGGTYAEVTSKSRDADEDFLPTKLKFKYRSKSARSISKASSVSEGTFVTATSIMKSTESSMDENDVAMLFRSMKVSTSTQISGGTNSSTSITCAEQITTTTYSPRSDTTANEGSTQQYYDPYDLRDNWHVDTTYRYPYIQPLQMAYYPPSLFTYPRESQISAPEESSLANLSAQETTPVSDYFQSADTHDYDVVQPQTLQPYYYILPDSQSSQYVSPLYYPYQYHQQSAVPSSTLSSISGQPYTTSDAETGTLGLGISETETGTLGLETSETETGTLGLETSETETVTIGSEILEPQKSIQPKKRIRPDDDWTVSSAFLSNGELLAPTGTDTSPRSSVVNLESDVGIENPFNIGLNIDLSRVFERDGNRNTTLQVYQPEFSYFQDWFLSRARSIASLLLDHRFLELNMAFNSAGYAEYLAFRRSNLSLENLAFRNSGANLSNGLLHPRAQRNLSNPGYPYINPISSDNSLSDNWLSRYRQWDQYIQEIMERARNRRNSDSDGPNQNQ